MGRAVLAVLAAAGASMLLLAVASFVAMIMMVATNGMSEARVEPFAIAYLLAVTIANTVCAAAVARAVLRSPAWTPPLTIGVAITLLPIAVLTAQWLAAR